MITNKLDPNDIILSSSAHATKLTFL